ncbi:MAG: hypothetical protein LUC43_05260 [Burkholderiales bacterium]|nr:hypothetical protein [Burkholderiales bacterium]
MATKRYLDKVIPMHLQKILQSEEPIVMVRSNYRLAITNTLALEELKDDVSASCYRTISPS